MNTVLVSTSFQMTDEELDQDRTIIDMATALLRKGDYTVEITVDLGNDRG